MSPKSPLADLWPLDPQVTHLNHGSFGATPRRVLEAQARWRAEIEQRPSLFFWRRLPELIDQARRAVADFVGADPRGLVPVRNATAAVNAVVASCALRPGDELLTTDHAYNACRNALERHAQRAGAKLVVAAVPFPLTDPAEVTERILAAATPRTRLALIDHVTSPTGLVLPIVDVARALEERGVPVLVDGAHAPGMVPLDLETLGASYYTGNCHKWMCAPKGAAFLSARSDRRDTVEPAILSHGWNGGWPGRTRMHQLFDWTGTDDPTPWLCVPDAIAFMADLTQGGWPQLMAENRAKALEARERLCEALGHPQPAPESMVGAMAAIPLPPSPTPIGQGTLDPLLLRLMDHWRIDVPIIPWPRTPQRLVRISAQHYNSPDDYTHLAAALQTELGR
jgi:isopenicillin-N epimerase